MGTRIARWVAMFAVAIVVAGACTNDTSSGDSGGSGGSGGDTAITTGVTDDSITLSMIATDLSALAEQNLAPDLGDPAKVVQTTVDSINADGGVDGRTIELTTHTLPFSLTPEAGRAGCLQATEEDGAFAVIVAPAVFVDVVRCVAVQNQTITLGTEAYDDALYDEAKGRLFAGGSNISMSANRSAVGFVQQLDRVGAFDGKTVGLLSAGNTSQPEIMDSSLKPALKKLDVELAAEATLPLAEGDQDCTQQDVGIQKMKDANVDLVLLAAPNLCGASAVAAAEKAEFTPQWATYGNNVTNTVASFFAPSKQNFNGAIGVSTQFGADSISDEAKACNELLADKAGLDYTPGSDRYGFAAILCMQTQLIAKALGRVKGDLNQASMIAAMESITSVPSNAGPAGSWSKTKHDSGDWVFMAEYQAAEGRFVTTDPKPREVP
jgi:ABC-type branched-subunit amino acid transport system substrate-binding protein